MPVNTGGYAAQKAPSSYDGTGLSTYLSQGFVYVYAGCRGRSNGTNPDGTAYDGGAPWGVTDLKAAVRYLRYNDSLIPGNKNRIFTFGHSGGGAQSALMGATGDSEMYMPYLSSIGALMKDSQGKPLSDAIDGAMCWYPITNLTQANLSYEWMMGQFSSEGTRAYGTWPRSLSRDMARAYTDSLNRMGLRDEQGNVLTLTQSESGIYMAGPYYDYLKTTIETSLNNFLKDNQFLLTTGQSDFQVDGAFPGPGAQESMGGWTPPKGAPVKPMAQEEPHTYNSAKEYIDALHVDTLTRQLMYDPMTFILVPAGEKKPSTLAKHWRIHTGISQGDTALTTEVNLALAFKQRKDVEDVDFATVWEKKHTMAERTGSSTENFIQWVKDSVASEK